MMSFGFLVGGVSAESLFASELRTKCENQIRASLIEIICADHGLLKDAPECQDQFKVTALSSLLIGEGTYTSNRVVFGAYHATIDGLGADKEFLITTIESLSENGEPRCRVSADLI